MNRISSLTQLALTRRGIFVGAVLMGGLVCILLVNRNNNQGDLDSQSSQLESEGTVIDANQHRAPERFSFNSNMGKPNPNIKQISYNSGAPLEHANEPELEGSYRLSQANWRQFESAMIRTWGSRLRAKSSDNGRIVHVQLPNNKKVPQKEIITLEIDRSENTVTFSGPKHYAHAWKKVVKALDYTPTLGQPQKVLVDMRTADQPTVSRAVNILTSHQMPVQENNKRPVQRAVQYAPTHRAGKLNVVSTYQEKTGNQENPNNQGGNQGGNQEGGNQDDDSGIIGPVRIQVVPELGTIIVTGDNPADVKRVEAIIKRLIGAAEQTQPHIETYKLEHANARSLAPTVQDLYDRNFQSRQGAITVSPLADQNALMLVGPKAAVESVKSLIEKLDVPTDDKATDFKVYALKYMSSIDAKNRIDGYFQGGQVTTPGGTQVQTLITISDYRSNQLVVRASASAIAIVDKLIASLDVVSAKTEANEMKIIPLKNAVATELALVITDAISGQQQGAGRGSATPGVNGIGGQGAGGQGGQGAQGQITQPTQVQADPASVISQVRAARLKLMVIDKDGKMVESGILFDVRITADANSNSLVVQGPKESMPLLEELVRQLDRVPNVETQLKVFTIRNGDAQTLFNTISALFGTQQGFGGAGGGQQQGQGLPLQNASVQDGATLANLRFTFEDRTNSIIASGPISDLEVVEDLLLRLDTEDANRRGVQIYRLANAPAVDVAATINDWLTNRTTLNQNDPESASLRVQNRREITVTAEPFSNALIVMANPEYIPEIERVIRAIDRRPPMVKVECLIAEVTLGDTTEYGVQLGVQDSLLFDRGLGAIGFPFNQANLGNNFDALSLSTRENLAGQGLSNLGLGRSNTELGYGGLVLSAGNESINVLMRALKDKRRVRVLSRPTIMTLDNLQGTVTVGAQVPRITDVQTTNFGVTNVITDTPVGVILAVTPRVSPDGTIVMAVDIQNSALGAEEDGIAIFITDAGDVIRSPQINTTNAQTTLQAKSGQTVVFSGLIQETDTKAKRGVPILSDIPAIGPLFSFETRAKARSELLIILTPYIVDNDEKIEHHNQIEMDRMTWCLTDVANVYGSTGYDRNYETTYGAPTRVYTPDNDPAAIYPQIGNRNPRQKVLGPAYQNQNAPQNAPARPTPNQLNKTQVPQGNQSSRVRDSARPIAKIAPAPNQIQQQSYTAPDQNSSSRNTLRQNSNVQWPENNQFRGGR